jgi:hypothetical protein
MNGPITWRTVNGPSLAEASRPLDSAAQLLSSGFGSLNNVLQKQDSVDKANWQQQKENNTNEFLNQIYAANGPDGFKALQDSGQLQQMLSGFGAQIDQAQARSTMDTRLGTLQQREKAGIEYGNFMTDEKQRPITQQIMSEAALGNKDAALKLMADNPDIRLPADLTKAIVAGERDLTKWNFEKEKMPLQLQGLRLDNAGQATQNAIGALNLDKTKLDFKDSQEMRKIEDQTAAAIQAHQQNKDVIGRNMGVIAKLAGLPTDSTGQPSFSTYDEDQLAKFNAAAKNNRQVKVPTAEEFMMGDTAVANNFVTKLSESGQFSPRLLKKARDGIRSGFDSNANSTLVGNDAFNRQIGNAQQQVWLNEVKDKNWNAPGTPDTTKQYNALAEAVPSLIDKTTGYDSQEDIAEMQKLVYDMAVKGIETSPGSNQFVTPSVEDMKHAIRTADGGLFRDAKRAENARAILQELVQTDPVKKRIAEAQKAVKIQRKIFTRDALGNQANLLP